MVVVGGVPPELTGFPYPVPDLRVCGYRFRVGTSGTSSETCGYCTRLSIGHCADCRRSLCHLHGTAGTPFLCSRCIAVRAATQREQGERRQAAIEAKRVDVNARVAACKGPDQLVSLLAEHEGQVSADTCRAAWVRLVREDAIEPSHDILTASGVRHSLQFGLGDMGRKWRETSRTPAWHAPNVVAPCELGAWLNAEGDVFHNGGGGRNGPSKSLFLPSTKVVLPRGAPLQLSPSLGSFGPIQLVGGHFRNVEGGFTVYPRDSDAMDYSRVVTEIVADSATPRSTSVS